MSAITRTVQSTATKEVSKATHEGWDLTFTVETTDTSTSVSVHGNDGNNAYLNASQNSDGHVNVSFSQGGYDATLAADVAAEMDAIMNPGE